MNNVMTSIEDFGKNISNGIGSFGNSCSESYSNIAAKLSNYFESKSYEEDLDSIIEALYAHTKKRPDLNISTDFKKRVNQKKDFLFGQAFKLVGAGALSGAWAAIESGNLPMVGEYALIGAAGAVIIIVVTVSGIIIKRVLNGTEMEFSKTSKAVELFVSPIKI